LILISVAGGGGLFTWLGYQYYWAGTCDLSLAIVVITTVFVGLFYIVAFLKCFGVNIFRENATIFTVTIASIYIVYLTWSAMAANYNPEC